MTRKVLYQGIAVLAMATVATLTGRNEAYAEPAMTDCWVCATPINGTDTCDQLSEGEGEEACTVCGACFHYTPADVCYNGSHGCDPNDILIGCDAEC